MGESPMLLAFDSTTAIVIVVMVCLAAVFSALLATQPVLRQKAVMILRER
jgi:archaellin